MQLNKVTLASLTIKLTMASAERACLTREDCEMKSLEMEIHSFYHSDNFPSKGCYSKNGKAFFSLGPEDEMTESVLPGVQERIWCDGAVSSVDAQVQKRDGSSRDSGRSEEYETYETADVVGQDPCLTGEDCMERSQEILDGRDTGFFYIGIFPSKGCFSKNDDIFFSLGTEEEMTTSDLPGLQERIWCDSLVRKAESDGSGTTASTSANAPNLPTDIEKNTSACLTSDECKQKSQEKGMTEFYGNNDFPSKGCYSKNGRAFFSLGSMEEMTKSILPGIQERILCGDPAALENGGESSSILSKSEEHATDSAIDHTPCLTQEDCRTTRQETMDIRDTGFFYVGTYPTKGCFSKNDDVFFSLGTAEEMSTSGVPGIQERIWCDGLASEEEAENVFTNSIGNATPNSQIENNVCLTEEECKQKSQEKGMIVFYSNSDFPSKGCYSKNGRAFFSLGPKKEMSEAILPGDQERIWCDGSFPSPTYDPTISPTELTSVAKISTPTPGIMTAPFPSQENSPGSFSTKPASNPTSNPTSNPANNPTSKPTSTSASNPTSTPADGTLSPDPTISPSGSSGTFYLRPQPSSSSQPTETTKEPISDQVDPYVAASITTGNDNIMKSSSSSVGASALTHGLAAIALTSILYLSF